MMLWNFQRCPKGAFEMSEIEQESGDTKDAEPEHEAAAPAEGDTPSNA